MITLKDIAKQAGVSVMTVSRVVNKRYDEVSKDNIEKIQNIIDKYGYIPNSSARSLSSKSSKIVAVIIQGEGDKMGTPYNAEMLGQIIMCIQKHGYSTMVHFIEDYSDINKHLVTWNADGAIFLGTFDRDIRKIQEVNKIPLVFTDSYSSVRQVINVGIDDYKGGALAAKHFVAMGHKSFAFINRYIHQSELIMQRFTGFCDALLEAGFKLDKQAVISEPYPDSCADILLGLTPAPTAIFMPSDNDAIEMSCILKERGCRLPEQYSIIGFDNLQTSSYISPKLTTIAQNIPEKARSAAELLFTYIENSSMPTRSIVLDVELIERESVADMRAHCF